MKMYAIVLSLSILMILMLGSLSYSQTSEVSTRAELVSLTEQAVNEIKVLRPQVDNLKQRQADYEDALAKAEKLDSDNQVLIGYLKDEIGKVRDALTDKQTALDAKQKEVDIYKAALAKEVKKKNFFKKVTEFSTVAAAVAVGLLVLKQ